MEMTEFVKVVHLQTINGLLVLPAIHFTDLFLLRGMIMYTTVNVSILK